ncbi:MAG: phospho-sugar mutase [Clostridiales bacterium]|nr:phospho-sugar mutase [Clostridiales bacterium]
MLGKEMFDIWYQKIPAHLRKELDAIKDNENEIKERFSVPLAFGTAGMRGEVGLGTFRMNDYTVARATKGLAMFIASLGAEAMERGVVISYDTRRCSLEFAIIVAKVLSYAKIKSFIFDTVHPVPMCSFAVRHLNAIAGVMITASHNPKEYNGYKVYGQDGAQMSPEDTQIVVKYIDSLTDYFAVELDGVQFPDSIKRLDNVKLNDYITVIGKTVDEAYYAEIAKLSLSPKEVSEYGKTIKLVYTPIHGTGYVPVTTMLSRMGISVDCVAEQIEPDTEFSTVPAPNPENPSALKMGIELGDKIGADVVIGTDPDCDRMGLAIRDNKGQFRLLNGNQIGALLLDYILTRLKEENNLPKNGAVVKTIVTTTLADRIAKNFGITVIDVLTGFKFIGEKIKEWEKTNEYSFIFGYEESYGYLRGTHARDKDAVVAAMLTAEMVCYYESKGVGLYQRLMEIFERYGYYCEEVISIDYKGVGAMAEMASAMAKVRSKTITKLAEYEVEFTADYLAKKVTYPDGRIEATTLPQTNAIKYFLKDGQFVCVRPSGTEPKLKVYVLCYDSDMEKSKQKAKVLLEAIKNEL